MLFCDRLLGGLSYGDGSEEASRANVPELPRVGANAEYHGYRAGRVALDLVETGIIRLRPKLPHRVGSKLLKHLCLCLNGCASYWLQAEELEGTCLKR